MFIKVIVYFTSRHRKVIHKLSTDLSTASQSSPFSNFVYNGYRRNSKPHRKTMKHTHTNTTKTAPHQHHPDRPTSPLPTSLALAMRRLLTSICIAPYTYPQPTHAQATPYTYRHSHRAPHQCTCIALAMQCEHNQCTCIAHCVDGYVFYCMARPWWIDNSAAMPALASWEVVGEWGARWW